MADIQRECMEQMARTTYLTTKEAYNLWAPIYDVDSNPLQALDDLELASLLPLFLALLPGPTRDTRCQIVDLGCGTGRNTLKLMSIPHLDLVGLDTSEKMLEIARNRCRLDALPREARARSLALCDFDILDQSSLPSIAKKSDGVISTLVLQHIPLPVFFSVAASLLVDGGHLLVTDLHPEAHAKSQAGFKDPDTGGKIEPQSYVYDMETVVMVAHRHNLEMIGETKERMLTADMAEKLAKRAVKWIGVKCWFGLVFRKRDESAYSS